MKKGAKHTKETKQKISKAMKGKKQSEEHVRKAAETRKGKHRSEETKQKMSMNHANFEGKNNPMYDVHRMGKNSPRYKHGLTGTKDYTKEYNKQYRQENKDKINAHAAKRRAWKLNQTPIFTELKSEKILMYYRIREYLGKGWNVDHIIPLNKGGLHHPDNLQIVTKKYNLEKRDKLNFRAPTALEYFKI